MKKAIIPEEMTALNAFDSKDKSTSETAQKRRVLEYLQTTTSGLNRYEAERLLNVCHLAARINSLRAEGHVILKTTEMAVDPFGHIHRGIARYFLATEQVAA